MLLDFEGSNAYSTSLKLQACVDDGEPCYMSEVILDRVNIPKAACYFGPQTAFIIDGRYLPVIMKPKFGVIGCQNIKKSNLYLT